MAKLSGIAFIVFSLLSIFSFFSRNEFSAKHLSAIDLQQDPKQPPTFSKLTQESYNDVVYEISPQFDYEITGLVVSFRHHDGDYNLHKSSNDHLNSADLCLVWGANATELDLNQFDFWNGQFTCNIKTSNQTAWDNFDGDRLSNNHLISADNYIRDQISSVKIGDVVRMRGTLASYSANGNFVRGTSTVRTDTGNGACETIHLDDFEIIARMSNIWRLLFWPLIALTLGSLFAYIYSPQHQ